MQGSKTASGPTMLLDGSQLFHESAYRVSHATLKMGLLGISSANADIAREAKIEFLYDAFFDDRAGSIIGLLRAVNNELQFFDSVEVLMEPAARLR